MADQQNISIKIGLDTSQFNNSIKGMTAELKALQKIDLTLLSPADSKAVIARMGDLKDSIKDVKKEIDNADPGQFFQSFSTLAGPVIAAISGIAVGMEMFGAKTEEVEKVQRKLMAVISLISTLQTIADANKLKGLLKQIPLQAMELKNRLTNALLIKQEVIATTADVAMKNIQQASIVKLTLLQKLWNKAVMANPIMLMVAGIMALIGAIILLTKAFSKNNEEVKESEKTMDGLIIKNKEVRDSYNETLKELQKMNLEYQKEAGLITPFQYDREKAKQDLEFFTAEQKQLMNEKIDELDLNAKKKKLVLSAFDPAGNSIISDEQLKELDKKQKQMYDAILVFNAKVKNQNRIFNQSEANARVLESDKLGTEIASIEADRTRTTLEQLRFETDQKLFEAERNYKGEARYLELVAAIEERYRIKRNEIIQKEKEDRLKITTDNYNKLIQATEDAEMKLKEAQGVDTEYEKLNIKYEEDLKAQEDFHEKNKTSEEDFLKAKEELLSAYYLNIEIITIKRETDIATKIAAWRKQYIAQTTAEQRDAEIAELEKTGKELGASTEDIAQARAQIEKKYTTQISEYKNDIFNQDLRDKAEKEIAALNTSLLNQEEYEKQRQDILDKYKQMDDQRQQNKMDTLELMNQAAMGALQIISDQQQAANDAEYERMNQLYDDKKAKFDEQLEYGIISQAEYDARIEDMEKKKAEEERKLRIKAAKQEKMMAIISIALSTAMAIMKAYATLGPIGGTAALPFLIGAGVIQAAVVAAKPIPQFAEGGTMKKGGTALVGEKGPELVYLPSGAQVISNKSLSQSTNRVYNPVSDITNMNSNGVSFQQMAEFVDISFEKYSQIPITLKMTELDRKQTEYKNIKINSEVQ